MPSERCRPHDAATFDYPAPNRVSLDQLCGILGRFLETPSGGLRAQAAATALMRTLGSAFSIFSRVEGQGINEPDRARNVPGDIMCYGPPNRPGEPEEIKLAVDVKSGRLRLADLQGSIVKARKNRVSSFLFAAPGFWEEERPGMERIVVGEFFQGLNVYVTSIEGLARSAFMLLEEEHRTEFLSAIGEELDARAAPPRTGRRGRTCWRTSAINDRGSCYRSGAAGGAGTIWRIVGNRSGSAPAAWR